MDKVGIITCGKEPNYGACLQALATLNKIIELGYDAELMNYSFGSDKFYSPFAQPSLKSAIIATLFYFPRKAQCKAFDRFRESHMRYSSSRLYSLEDFSKVKDEYKCFVTGSDQVWNPNLGIDINITLQRFLNDDKIKSISYASSFGSNSLDSSYNELFKSSLKRFQAISVREKSGVDIVNGLLGESICKAVCDPVMLYDSGYWSKYCDDSRTPSEKYVIIYDMRHSSEVFDCAVKLAKIRGCKVISISRVKMLKKGVRFITDLSPSHFLSYFKNAEAVITDSFHGTVFSILFHKEFYTFCSGSGKKIGERLISILNTCHLKDRLYEKSKDVVFSNIDYSKVDPFIEEFRMHSIDYLSNSLRKVYE